MLENNYYCILGEKIKGFDTNVLILVRTQLQMKWSLISKGVHLKSEISSIRTYLCILSSHLSFVLLKKQHTLWANPWTS